MAGHGTARGPIRAAAAIVLAAILSVALGAVRQTEAADASALGVKRYNVVFNGTATKTGFSIDGGREAALALVASAGGTVISDLSKEIGAVTVVSANPSFATTVAASSTVEAAGDDFAWKALPTPEEATASGELRLAQPGELPGGPEPSDDMLESEQWALELICVNPDPRPGCGPTGAESVQAGSPLVEVGVLDTGIEGTHPDFWDSDGTNVNCAKGRDFVLLVGPGLGNPDPCIDNGFHGTHVAGIIGARANNPTGIPGAGIGIRGVAPNVELIPVKVCDTVGYCYASSTAAGITYAGQAKFEVINMSFFVDDDFLLDSTEFKCMSDPVQRAFRKMNERAIQYARQQGVVPVAALGNSDEDLAHPPEPYENDCEVVPAETQGVIGTMALGRDSEKATYSNYGNFAVDVGAPGGSFGILSDTPNEFCEEQILSTVPEFFGFYGCFQGTSMASPHAAGVAALIVSQFGRIANDAGTLDVVMRPQDVEQRLQSTTVDIGLKGYDECFGNGRINALRAVLHQTSNVYDPSAPPCPEYAE